MKRYNVRLEHDPIVPIGELTLEDELRSGHNIVVREGRDEYSFVLDFYDPFALQGEPELAIRSDKPLAFWRRVPGFTENKEWRSHLA